MKQYCRQPKRNDENKSHKNNHQDGKAMNVTDEEFVLMSFESKMETKQNHWILDSGASNHMTNSLDGFKEMQTVHQKVTVGNGKKIAVVQSGTWEGYVKNTNGKHQKVILEKVDYIPDLVCNLFSLTTALMND